jgi:hypothetical protein
LANGQLKTWKLEMFQIDYVQFGLELGVYISQYTTTRDALSRSVN